MPIMVTSAEWIVLSIKRVLRTTKTHSKFRSHVMLTITVPWAQERKILIEWASWSLKRLNTEIGSVKFFERSRTEVASVACPSYHTHLAEKKQFQKKLEETQIWYHALHVHPTMAFFISSCHAISYSMPVETWTMPPGKIHETFEIYIRISNEDKTSQPMKVHMRLLRSTVEIEIKVLNKWNGTCSIPNNSQHSHLLSDVSTYIHL